MYVSCSPMVFWISSNFCSYLLYDSSIFALDIFKKDIPAQYSCFSIPFLILYRFFFVQTAANLN